jgi:hypothetical protein
MLGYPDNVAIVVASLGLCHLMPLKKEAARA